MDTEEINSFGDVDRRGVAIYIGDNVVPIDRLETRRPLNIADKIYDIPET